MLVDPSAPVSETDIQLLVRSPIDCRDESSSRDEYSQLILLHGMNWDARSTMCTVAMDTPPRPDFSLVLVACHCVESVDGLHAKLPDHPMARLAMQTGALHAVDLLPGTPEDPIYIPMFRLLLVDMMAGPW